jgi:dolichol-phosphate mannosyltransferase
VHLRLNTLLVIPTYNEAKNVKNLTKELFLLNEQFDILFVDDSSPDGTADVIRQLQSESNRIHLLLRPQKNGIGGALLAGILWAYDHGYSLCATMDADFTHSPVDLGRLFQNRGSNDIMIASRFKSPGSLPGWSLWRRFLTHLGNFATGFFMGLPFDSTGSLRVFNISRIPRRMFELPTERGYAFIFEVLLYLHVNGFQVGEIPVILPARMTGSSKMSAREIFRSVNTILRLGLVRIFLPSRLRVLPLEVNSSLEDSGEWDAYWNVSTTYAEVLFAILAGFYRRWLIRPAFQRSVRRHFQPGTRLLHAGCGSGEVDASLIQDFDIMALDYSRRALEIYLANNGQLRNVVQASIVNLPFEDESFDGVFNLGVMEHFSEDVIAKIFREFHRVLRPGGKILIWWPPEFGFSVLLFKGLGRIKRLLLRDTSKSLIPDEISRVKSKEWLVKLVNEGSFHLEEYSFGAQDAFTQVLVVARKLPSNA